jgi:CDP-glucose 4,6-dehydratase
MEIMEIATPDKRFWKGKKVFVTGHTGFKGSWLCILLNYLGAEVYGYALEPNTQPALYNFCNIDSFVHSTIGDIRDIEKLKSSLQNSNPDIIIHMAAQPLVRLSYQNPVETFDINVMGTVHLLESARYCSNVKAIVNVTTDKCYENKEWPWGYRENEPMGGYDPYSSSKGCSELVTSAYRNSFFNPNQYSKHGVAVASARAGNVIGGGDWAEDRLIPDFVRSIQNNQKILIRSPKAIRPWQHVLEPLSGYLVLAEALYTNGTEFAQAWNFGPNEDDVKNVEWIVNTICEKWGNGAAFAIDPNPQPHEATYLKLDCSKAKTMLNWHPRWDINKTIQSIIEFNKAFQNKENILELCMKQIENYFVK